MKTNKYMVAVPEYTDTFVSTSTAICVFTCGKTSLDIRKLSGINCQI